MLVDIYIADLNDLAHCEQQYVAYLSADEQARMARFARASLQRDFVLSHGMMRVLLARYLEIAPNDVVYAKGEHGKPFLGMVLTSSLHFNLSHSADKVVLAVSRDAVVGVDIQHHDPRVDVLSLARRFFSEKEYQQLCAAEATQQHDLFYQLWSIDEAFVKMRGTGLSQALSEFSVLVHECCVSIEQHDVMPPVPCSVYFCQDITGYSLACAAEARQSQFSLNYFQE